MTLYVFCKWIWIFNAFMWSYDSFQRPTFSNILIAVICVTVAAIYTYIVEEKKRANRTTR